MPYRAFSLVLALALMALSWSCAREDAAAPTPDPVRTVTPAPAATSEPSPSASSSPVLNSSGWLIFARDGDLYLGALDGTGVQQLTSGASDAAYAGVAVVDGARWLYFIEPNAGDESGTEVRRRRLDGGETEPLFTFGAGAERGALGAAVSPDGSTVAYTDIVGLVVRNMANGAETLLRPNVIPCETPERCRRYREPAWSPDGTWISVIAGLYEGAEAELVSLDGKVIELAHGAGGNFLAWPPAGSDVCVSEFGYAIGSAGLLRPEAPEYVPLRRADGVAPSTIWCGWSPTGRLAVAVYDEPAPNSSAKHLALVGDGGTIGAPVHVAATDDSVLTQFVWLPDGSGLVSQVSLECAVCGPVPRDIVLMLDGTARRLPFDTGRVIAAITE